MTKLSGIIISSIFIVVIATIYRLSAQKQPLPLRISTIKTGRFEAHTNLYEFIRREISDSDIPEGSVVVITSKIVALAQGRIAPKDTDTREEIQELAKKDAEAYIDPIHSPYGLLLSKKGCGLAINAGLDSSNCGNCYCFLPDNVQNVANNLWHFFRTEYNVTNVGVIITDSRSFPLYAGVIGVPLAHCGFEALKDYRGTCDLYGRVLQVEQSNISWNLAALAVYAMGEGDECTPLAVIENPYNVIFQNRVPTKEELARLNFSMEDCMYSPLFKSAPWTFNTSDQDDHDDEDS